MQQVSDEEIAREVRTLRDLRRRSGSTSGPGELAIDPDLPPSSSSSSSIPSPTYSSNDDITLTPDGIDGDPGLFWVPAHLHPELAPGEFKAFLKAHTHPDPLSGDATDAGEAAGLSRSPSWLARRDSRTRGGAGDLGRKRSMLSRQYQPKAGDKVEEEAPPLPNRQRASIYGGRSGDQGLTLEDLQKLEMMVEEAGEEDDPAAMRKMIRRSLSMSLSPSYLADDIPRGSEEADSPIIPPRPGSILRRSAHTKIRKASLAGDGGGHRFAATRKGRMTAAPQIEIPGLYDDDGGASSRRQKSGSDESEEALRDEGTSADSHDERWHDAPQHLEERRPSDSSTDEAYIFDAYARDSRSSSVSSTSEEISAESSPTDEDTTLGGGMGAAGPLRLPNLPAGETDWFGQDGERTPTATSMSDPFGGARRPSPGVEGGDGRPAGPQINLGAPTLQVPTDSRTAGPQSPTSPTTPHARTQPLPGAGFDLPPGMAPPAPRTSQQATRPSPEMTPVSLDRPPLARTESNTSAASSIGSLEKRDGSSSSLSSKKDEKKGGFFSKKDKKDKDGGSKSKKDKDRFLGGLFGGNKKKQEESSSVSNFSSAGPAAAAALLGSSKSAKSLGVSPSPSPTSPGFNSYARYPIHVERAVYRLSHIKLANARRPLYEQVLISNLMFWYLGVIGRNVAEEKKAPAASTDKEKPNGLTTGDEEKREAKPPQKGTPPKAADTGVAGKALPHERPEPVAPSPQKKTGLTKPERARGGRDHEQPVRTPSYGTQNAQVESEMRHAGMMAKQPGGMGGPRPPSAGGGGGGGGGGAPQYFPDRSGERANAVSSPGGGPPPPTYTPHQRSTSSPGQSQLPRSMSQPPPSGGPGLAQQQLQSRPASEFRAPPPQQQQQQQHHPTVPQQQPSPPRTHQSPPPAGFAPHPHPQHHSQPLVHPPARGGPPQSSFGAPPPPADMRQRTLSNPNHNASAAPPPGSGGMRRVVTDGRPPFPPQQQAQPGMTRGPQPGQLFQYPPGAVPPASPFGPRPSPGPQPGQIFAPPTSGIQPGQVFHHPQRPPPPHLGQPLRSPPPQRLPPEQQQFLHPNQQLPPHLRRPSPGPPDQYGRPMPQQQGGGGYYGAGPPRGGGGGVQPGQVFAGYPGGGGPPPQQQQGRGQVVGGPGVGGQGYAHHR